MCVFGGSGASAAAQQQATATAQQNKLMQDQAAKTQADADTRNAAIASGKQNIDSAFSGFDDGFFNNLSNNYVNYAKPQLDDQYDQQKKNIIYSLANKGTLNSTMAGDQKSILDKQYATNLTGIEGTGSDYANNARAQVAADKADVTNQLLSSGDPNMAQASALSAAKSISAVPSFSPLGALFTNVSALAAQNRLAADANPYGNAGAKLFGSGAGTSAGYTVQ